MNLYNILSINGIDFDELKYYSPISKLNDNYKYKYNITGTISNKSSTFLNQTMKGLFDLINNTFNLSNINFEGNDFNSNQLLIKSNLNFQFKIHFQILNHYNINL